MRSFTTCALVAAVSLVSTSTASAALVNVATYDFEDNATPAGFTEFGTPSYAGGEFVGDGSSGLFNDTSPLTATDNFVMEARLTPSAVDVFDFALGNTEGDSNNGYGILLEAGNWKLIRMGQVVTDTGVPVALGTEVNIAFVRQGGNSQLYLNGVPIGASHANAAAPTRLNIGYNPFDGGAGGFNGTIDEIRLSTVGANDQLTLGQDGFIAVVPEPGSLALLGLGGLAMLRRRRA